MLRPTSEWDEIQEKFMKSSGTPSTFNTAAFPKTFLHWYKGRVPKKTRKKCGILPNPPRVNILQGTCKINFVMDVFQNFCFCLCTICNLICLSVSQIWLALQGILYFVSRFPKQCKHISIPNSSFRFFPNSFFSIVSIVIVIIIAQCSQFKKSLQYFMIINSFMQYFREKSEFIFVFLQQLLCKAQDFSKHFNPSLRNSILGINSPEMSLG